MNPTPLQQILFDHEWFVGGHCHGCDWVAPMDSGLSGPQNHAVHLSELLEAHFLQRSGGMTTGTLIDSLGVEARVPADDLVSDAVLILRVVEPGGDERVTTAWSEGLSWVTRSGMLYNSLHTDTAGSERR